MTHKYHAIPTTVDNIRFASKAEARRYSELRLLEKAGAIKRLRLQPKFLLVVAKYQTGAPVSVGYYIADFQYDVPLLHGAWKTITEDVKGVRTETYRLKKKIVEATYGITITEITR